MMISASVKINWNPTELRKKEERAERNWLYKAGGYLRQTVRRSIRRVSDRAGKLPRKSKPGRPPYAHPSGQQFFTNLRDSILFNVNPATEEVIVGPIRQHEKIGKLHEFGGTKTIKTAPGANRVFSVGDIGPVASGKYADAKYPGMRIGNRLIDPVSKTPVIYIKLKTKKQAEHATRLNRRLQMAYFAKKHTAHYPERPYMRPGLTKAAPILDDFWYNTIR